MTMMIKISIMIVKMIIWIIQKMRDEIIQRHDNPMMINIKIRRQFKVDKLKDKRTQFLKYPLIKIYQMINLLNLYEI